MNKLNGNEPTEKRKSATELAAMVSDQQEEEHDLLEKGHARIPDSLKEFQLKMALLMEKFAEAQARVSGPVSRYHFVRHKRRPKNYRAKRKKKRRISDASRKRNRS